MISKWTSPEALFAALERGEVKMMRPTQRTLLDAMELGSIERILSSKPVISTVHPNPEDSQSSNPVRDSERQPRR